MSPTQFNNDHHQNHNNQHAKREQLIHGACPVPLKINKDSHFIKKTSPSSSSSSTSSLAMAAATTPPPKPQQHRHPVIIYTHSPKVIHTHPRDFMALVQKLTGFSRSDGDENAHRTAKSAVTTGNEISEGGENNNNNNNKNNKNKRGVKGSFGTEDNESSSAITTEDNCGDGQVNSCLLPPYFDPPPNPYLTNMPLFAPNSAEFLCSNPPLFNYTDSLFFNPPPNMRNSTLEAMNEFRDY